MALVDLAVGVLILDGVETAALAWLELVPLLKVVVVAVELVVSEFFKRETKFTEVAIELGP